jgi:hypothetical protein
MQLDQPLGLKGAYAMHAEAVAFIRDIPGLEIDDDAIFFHAALQVGACARAAVVCVQTGSLGP